MSENELQRDTRTLVDYVGLVAQGFVMGASNLVPGVSGGTMALIMGIYEELISSIKSVLNRDAIKLALRFKIKQALSLVPQSDVVLVSTKLVNNGALKLIQNISQCYEDTKVLAMGLSHKQQNFEVYIESGADGIIHNDDSIEDLVEHIRASTQEKALIPPSIAYKLMARVAEFSQLLDEIEVGTGDLSDLTRREEEILGLIARGLSNQEIADQLYIELGTVKNHVHSILDKLNVNSRVDAAAYLGLVKSRQAPV